MNCGILSCTQPEVLTEDFPFVRISNAHNDVTTDSMTSRTSTAFLSREDNMMVLSLLNDLKSNLIVHLYTALYTNSFVN